MASSRPLVSLVVPAYNESAIVQRNLGVLCDYMKSLEHKYEWEIIVANDGSRDDTSALAREFASTRDNVFVFDHIVNFGLGQALKFAFNQCRGEYIVTVDMDLSYSPGHIERLLDKLRETRAKIVIASPLPGRRGRGERPAAAALAQRRGQQIPVPHRSRPDQDAHRHGAGVRRPLPALPRLLFDGHGGQQRDPLQGDGAAGADRGDTRRPALASSGRDTRRRASRPGGPACGLPATC